MYKILGTDEKEYGPVRAEVLRRWISERRANSETRVQAEGSTEWKPLSEFPEFKDALADAMGRVPAGAMPPSIPMPPSPATLPAMTAPARTSGLAIASLILGVLGLCTGITSILGLVFGLIALIKINNSRGKLSGQGLAIAGMCISGLALMVLPGLMLPALAKAKARAQSINCVNNLRQIGVAARRYADSHQETFPEDFLSLSNELVNPKFLVCPADRTRTKASAWPSLSPDNITYEFVSPGSKESAPSKVLVRCPIHEHVCLADGSVVHGRVREKY